MIEATRARIDGHWARRFGTPVPGPFPITVSATGCYDAAALVVVLGGHAHVDAPLAHLDEIVVLTAGRAPGDLLDPALWAPLASDAIVGPADHYWADRTTPLAMEAPEIPLERLAELRPLVTQREWLDSGLDSDALIAYGVEVDGVLLAAAILSTLWGWPADVGLLVAPDARRHGYGRRVAVSALTAAVAVAGFGAFRVERGADTSRAVAESLALAPYGSHLLVPLAP